MQDWIKATALGLHHLFLKGEKGEGESYRLAFSLVLHLHIWSDELIWCSLKPTITKRCGLAFFPHSQIFRSPLFYKQPLYNNICARIGNKSHPRSCGFYFVVLNWELTTVNSPLSLFFFNPFTKREEVKRLLGGWHGRQTQSQQFSSNRKYNKNPFI